jgi:rhodanese-related sulfurtransferase
MRIQLYQPFQEFSTPLRVGVLKNRLDWGEPALTIIDVRDRPAFNASHIMGAIAMPIAELVSRAQASLEFVRDIYVYGESEEQTIEAAEQLRNVGYQHIAELIERAHRLGKGSVSRRGSINVFRLSPELV